MNTKAAYVKSQGQTRSHHCHWPGCEKQVPPAMWGCKTHWFRLPQALRNQIWATYVPGQEMRGNPRKAYIAVARDVQEWIKRHEARTADRKEIEKFRSFLADSKRLGADALWDKYGEDYLGPKLGVVSAAARIGGATTGKEPGND